MKNKSETWRKGGIVMLQATVNSNVPHYRLERVSEDKMWGVLELKMGEPSDTVPKEIPVSFAKSSGGGQILSIGSMRINIAKIIGKDPLYVIITATPTDTGIWIGLHIGKEEGECLPVHVYFKMVQVPLYAVRTKNYTHDVFHPQPFSSLRWYQQAFWFWPWPRVYPRCTVA
jgi:hypothetical protein